MNYHIGYWGGTCGDILRGLIVSGLKDIKTEFDDNKLWVKYNNWRPVIEISAYGCCKQKIRRYLDIGLLKAPNSSVPLFAFLLSFQQHNNRLPR